MVLLMKKRTYLLIIFYLIVLAAPGACFAQETENACDEIAEVLTRLEHNMSEIKSISSGFVQEKDLALFKNRLLIKGFVYLKKPDLLAWYVTEPLRYKVVIKGDTIAQWDEETDKTQKISIKKNPALQAVFEQMNKWFSGAYSSMTSEYRIMLLSRAPVSFRFIPKEGTYAHNAISSVTVVFRDDERYIQKIEIKEKTGDFTNIRFINTLLNGIIADTAWELKPSVQ